MKSAFVILCVVLAMTMASPQGNRVEVVDKVNGVTVVDHVPSGSNGVQVVDHADNGNNGVQVVDYAANDNNGVPVITNPDPSFYQGGNQGGPHINPDPFFAGPTGALNLDPGFYQGGNYGNGEIINPDPGFYQGGNYGNEAIINPDPGFYQGGGGFGNQGISNPDPFFSQGGSGNIGPVDSGFYQQPQNQYPAHLRPQYPGQQIHPGARNGK